jgi:hypothetical protein
MSVVGGPTTTPLRVGSPYRPEPGMVYWIETTLLPPGDPEFRRPVVVVGTPETADGTVTVVARSTSDDFGVEHPADRDLGLSAPGRFSRRHPVPGRLWTPRDVAPVGPLDAVTLAAVRDRFLT